MIIGQNDSMSIHGRFLSLEDRMGPTFFGMPYPGGVSGVKYLRQSRKQEKQGTAGAPGEQRGAVAFSPPKARFKGQSIPVPSQRSRLFLDKAGLPSGNGINFAESISDRFR
jgi:hypothetical protein